MLLLYKMWAHDVTDDDWTVFYDKLQFLQHIRYVRKVIWFVHIHSKFSMPLPNGHERVTIFKKQKYVFFSHLNERMIIFVSIIIKIKVIWYLMMIKTKGHCRYFSNNLKGLGSFLCLNVSFLHTIWDKIIFNLLDYCIIWQF